MSFPLPLLCLQRSGRVAQWLTGKAAVIAGGVGGGISLAATPLVDKDNGRMRLQPMAVRRASR